MARIGTNPARGKFSNYNPARVTVAVLTYIPDVSGYFKHRLQIIQLVLASIRAHTTIPYDLMVFDNGSCQPLVDYLLELHKAGEINYLLLSQENIGKIGAMQIIFNSAPGEVIAYSDDDILFYPQWLEAHLEILDNFPQVGMVSGVPVRNAAGYARHSLDRLVEQPPTGMTIYWERRIPDTWETDWALSTGRDPERHLIATQGEKDLVLRMNIAENRTSLEAIGAANHFQFVAPKHVLLEALPENWSGKLMGSMVELDEAVDALGYLRLSTTKRYTRHLGNTLSTEVLEEIQELDLPEGIDAAPVINNQRKPRRKHILLRVPGGRQILSTVYNRLFEILYR